MKIVIRAILVAGISIFASAQAHANEACAALENVISDMDILADALEDSGHDPDDRLDAELRSLVVDLRDIAEACEDDRSINAVNGMVDGWNDGDADLYLRSSDRLAARFEFFLNSSC